VLGVTVLVLASCATQARSPTATGTVTLFSDSFRGNSLDLSKWQPNWVASTGDATTKPVNRLEASCYDPGQVSVSGGYLHLRAVRRQCTANNGKTYEYASGLVNTRDHFTFTYGRMEARIFVPGGSGAAENWGAFWANGTGTWPHTGELDVWEALSGRNCWHFHSDAGGPGGCASMSNRAGWHTFAANWQPGKVTFIYDGKTVGSLTSGITGDPMYLILNLGLSNTIAEPITTPSEMLVDYVKVTR
jgi:beta-glucanase (GH16 family)